MAKLILINNIFNPSDKEEHQIKNKKIYEVLDNYKFKYAQYKDVQYVFAINGNITENLYTTLKEGDELVVAPIPSGGGGGGKNPLKMIAMLALTVASGGASAGWFATSGMFAAGTVSASLLGAGVMMAGGALINSAFPVETPSTKVSNDLSEVSPTYSFGNASNATQEGTSYPLVIGTMQIVPPILGEYFSTENDKQYYNAMYAIHDGQIDNITDIKVNNQDINSYDNVTYEIRYGTNNQSAIPFYKDRVTHSLGRTLNVKDDIETYTTISNALNEVQICMSLSGLYDVRKGDYKKYPLSFEISYKKSSDADYTVFKTVSLNTIYRTTKKLVYSIKNLPTSSYDIKVKRLSSYSTNTMIKTIYQ
jgi:predicted phage tail protein